MTREEAMTMSEGKIVTSPHTVPVRRPFRLTKVYLPADGKGTPMCQIAAYKPGVWIHLEAFDPAPKGQIWNTQIGEWRPK